MKILHGNNNDTNSYISLTVDSSITSKKFNKQVTNWSLLTRFCALFLCLTKKIMGIITKHKKYVTWVTYCHDNGYGFSDLEQSREKPYGHVAKD